MTRSFPSGLAVMFLASAISGDPNTALSQARREIAAKDCRSALATLQPGRTEAAAIKDRKQRDDALAALHFYSALASSDCGKEEDAETHLREFFRVHPQHSSLDSKKFP